jgi:hypothetical protein
MEGSYEYAGEAIAVNRQMPVPQTGGFDGLQQ